MVTNFNILISFYSMSTSVKKENDKRKGMVKVVTYPATRACSIENGATKKIALKKI